MTRPLDLPFLAKLSVGSHETLGGGESLAERLISASIKTSGQHNDELPQTRCKEGGFAGSYRTNKWDNWETISTGEATWQMGSIVS